jgi:SAM-dependent methyltransferase
MKFLDNRDVYVRSETRWGEAEGLEGFERFLITQYLDPAGSTLEAGCGGGRILRAMQEMGFTRMCGFDAVPQFIALARRKDSDGAISFDVQNATHLKYASESVDQIIYWGQLLSLLESAADRLAAVREARRVLKRSGRALLSFCCAETRRAERIYLPYLLYVRCLRCLLGKRLTLQSLPWLRLRGKPNWRALLDAGPYVYWYHVDEAVHLLESQGFRILGMGNSRQPERDGICTSRAQLLKRRATSHLYIIAEGA